MKNIPLILMGCGGVGRQLLQHIVSCRSLHSTQGLCLRVVGVGDSTSLLVSDDLLHKGLDDTVLLQLCRVKSAGESLSKLWEGRAFGHPESEGKILEIASQLGRKTGLVLVDCSASFDTVVVLKQAIHMGCCAVLANKKPLTSSMDISAHGPSFYLDTNAQVGAGLPVIASLNRIICSGDPVHQIIGSLSGTLGYVMSEVEDGKPLSQVVKDAKSLGYTEPDPRDDLGGMDVARKALILARILGHQINLDSIQIESLYPKEMGPDIMTVEDFLDRGLSLLDKDIQARVEKAASNGNVLRYASIVCEVGIQELPKNSPLGRLRGSDNVLEIYTRCYSKQPLVIQGAGAGNDTTAAGVLADIVDLQDLFS
ncbi:Bifunctional aspartokinase/homoserine dehydrogenase [Vigna angularis]|uniref:Homoserine dehydrogenase n=1 Tax=Phaseolus angularis TaxID=3914 RepID=A0A8T0K3W2_PHAAN|nr:Bifunctional aspartokinase/homoserine dehydrogenase [Vigna angularis]